MHSFKWKCFNDIIIMDGSQSHLLLALIYFLYISFLKLWNPNLNVQICYCDSPVINKPQINYQTEFRNLYDYFCYLNCIHNSLLLLHTQKLWFKRVFFFLQGLNAALPQILLFLTWKYIPLIHFLRKIQPYKESEQASTHILILSQSQHIFINNTSSLNGINTHTHTHKCINTHL